MRNLTLALYCVLIVAACGTQTQHEKVEPCALVTKSEVESILGEPVGEAERVPQAGRVITCQYKVTSESRIKAVQITLIQTPLTEESARSIDKVFNDYKEEAKQSNIQVQQISGIGEDALWNGEALLFVKKGKYVQVKLTSLDKPLSLEIAKALAIKSLSRLEL